MEIVENNREIKLNKLKKEEYEHAIGVGFEDKVSEFIVNTDKRFTSRIIKPETQEIQPLTNSSLKTEGNDYLVGIPLFYFNEVGSVVQVTFSVNARTSSDHRKTIRVESTNTGIGNGLNQFANGFKCKIIITRINENEFDIYTEIIYNLSLNLFVITPHEALIKPNNQFKQNHIVYLSALDESIKIVMYIINKGSVPPFDVNISPIVVSKII